MVKYNGKEWTGYWSLCAALNRALDVRYNFVKASPIV